MRETLQLVCKRENGEGLQPEKLAENCMGMINKTVALILEGNHPSKNIPSYATLETYEETPIFIPVDITKEAVESVARKLLGEVWPRRHVLGSTTCVAS